MDRLRHSLLLRPERGLSPTDGVDRLFTLWSDRRRLWTGAPAGVTVPACVLPRRNRAEPWSSGDHPRGCRADRSQPRGRGLRRLRRRLGVHDGVVATETSEAATPPARTAPFRRATRASRRTFRPRTTRRPCSRIRAARSATRTRSPRTSSSASCRRPRSPRPKASSARSSCSTTRSVATSRSATCSSCSPRTSTRSSSIRSTRRRRPRCCSRRRSRRPRHRDRRELRQHRGGAADRAQVWQGRDIQAFLQVQALSEVKPDAKVGLIGIGMPVPAIKYLDRASEALRGGGRAHGGRTRQDNPTDDVTGGEKAANALLQRYQEIDSVIGYNDPRHRRGHRGPADGQGHHSRRASTARATASRVSRAGSSSRRSRSTRPASAARPPTRPTPDHEAELPLPPIVIRPGALVTKDNVN